MIFALAGVQGRLICIQEDSNVENLWEFHPWVRIFTDKAALLGWGVVVPRSKRALDCVTAFMNQGVRDPPHTPFGLNMRLAKSCAY